MSQWFEIALLPQQWPSDCESASHAGVRGSILRATGYPPAILWVEAFLWPGAQLLWGEMLGKWGVLDPTLV